MEAILFVLVSCPFWWNRKCRVTVPWAASASSVFPSEDNCKILVVKYNRCQVLKIGINFFFLQGVYKRKRHKALGESLLLLLYKKWQKYYWRNKHKPAQKSWGPMSQILRTTKRLLRNLILNILPPSPNYSH